MTRNCPHCGAPRDAQHRYLPVVPDLEAAANVIRSANPSTVPAWKIAEWAVDAALGVGEETP